MPASTVDHPAVPASVTLELLQRILKELREPFLVVSADGRSLHWNAALEQLGGHPLPASFEQMVAPEDREAALRLAARALAGAPTQPLQVQWLTPGGTSAPVEVRTVRIAEHPSLLLHTLSDLSERRRLEADLRQSQKMEAVGKLAGGIAHDFNNVLTTILGLTEAMMHGHTAPTSEHLREINQAARHAADLTRHLLAFSRRQILQMRDLSLESVVQDLARMVARVIGEDIRLEIVCREPAPRIRADRSQIEQVLLNLCLNARDAMPQGGDLRIEVRPQTLTDAWCRTHPGARPGPQVLLSVKDTGVGMDQETLSRVFEPFFTRKGVGKGTGLGLSMVYGIVKQHEGFIHVSSKPGAGTEFCLYFPFSLTQADLSSPPPRAQEAAAVQRGTATILVVEDEQSVRKLVLELLPRLGYRVFTAADGEEAIKVFERYAEQIDLVLLDAILPKKGGRAVYDAIRRRKPDMRFVFVSGYNEEFINSRFELEPSVPFLSKPFSTKQLTEVIGAALSSAP